MDKNVLHNFTWGQHIAYGFVHVFFYLLSLLPLSLLQAMGRVVGHLYYFSAKKRLKIARVNLQICFPDLPEQEREKIAKQSILSAAMWFFEAGPMWLWQPKKILKNVKVNNFDLLEQALASDKGVLLAVPHMGNWEVMGPFVSQYCQFACFYKNDKKHPLMSEFVRRQRSRHDIKMAPNDVKGVRILYRHLSEGKIAGLLPDHLPTDDMGVFAPFFGRQALTGTLISSLAKKKSAHVIAGTVLRTKEGFEIYFFPVADQYHEDTTVAASGLNKAMEDCIMLDPCQYQWTYPRFRQRPNPKQQPSPYRAAVTN